VTVLNVVSDEMTLPRSFAHSVRSWDCGERYGFKREGLSTDSGDNRQRNLWGKEREGQGVAVFP